MGWPPRWNAPGASERRSCHRGSRVKRRFLGARSWRASPVRRRSRKGPTSRSPCAMLRERSPPRLTIASALPRRAIRRGCDSGCNPGCSMRHPIRQRCSITRSCCGAMPRCRQIAIASARLPHFAVFSHSIAATALPRSPTCARRSRSDAGVGNAQPRRRLPRFRLRTCSHRWVRPGRRLGEWNLTPSYPELMLPRGTCRSGTQARCARGAVEPLERITAVKT